MSVSKQLPPVFWEETAPIISLLLLKHLQQLVALKAPSKTKSSGDIHVLSALRSDSCPSSSLVAKRTRNMHSYSKYFQVWVVSKLLLLQKRGTERGIV